MTAGLRKFLSCLSAALSPISLLRQAPHWAGHGRLPEEYVQTLSAYLFVLGRIRISFLICFLSTLSPGGRTGLPVHKLVLTQHEPHTAACRVTTVLQRAACHQRKFAQGARCGEEPGLTSHHSFKAAAYSQSTILRPPHPQGTSLAIMFLPVAVILLPSLSCFPPFAPPSCELQQKPLNLLFPLYKQLVCSQF